MRGRPFDLILYNVSTQDKLMKFPQWIDLKGQDTVPDTVHHVVVNVDPRVDRRWMRAPNKIKVFILFYGPV